MIEGKQPAISCSPPPSPLMESYSSQPSIVASSSSNGNQQDVCRFCHCEGGADCPLISPCYCSGSIHYVHHSCLQEWIKNSGKMFCELCKFHYIMDTKAKPLCQWEKPDLSPFEQRQVRRSMICLVLMVTCLGYSLFKHILLQSYKRWWIMLAIDVIGLTHALILLYFPCKMCGKLLQKWRVFNRIIYVHNAPGNEGQQSTAFSQLTARDLANEETKELSSDKELSSYQSKSNSNSHSSSTNSVYADNTMNISGKIATAEMVSVEATITSTTNSGLVLVSEHVNPLSEVVVISTTIDPVSRAGEQEPVPHLIKQQAEEDLQIDMNIA